MIKHLVVVLTWCLALLFSPAALPESPGRLFQLIYEVRLEVPSGGQELNLWIPLAASNQRQEIRRRVIQVSHPYRLTRDPEYGNDMLFLALRHPLPPILDLSVQYEADVREEQPPWVNAGARHGGFPEPDMSLYLRSTRYMAIDDDVRALAQSVTHGAAGPLEKARRIYRYVIERMRYEKETPGWGEGNTLRACAVGAGNCTDFHSLFISLARASGIPAQFQIGLPLPHQPDGEIPGYHCWAEFYLPEAGWVPVDASEAWKDRKKMEYFFGTYDPNRLAVSAGRDVELVPRAAAGPINIFFFPYAEIDGRVVEEERIKTRFRFRDLQLVQTRKQQGGLS